MAYLIGSVIRSIEVQAGIGNVLGLILGFIGVSFVPQSMLSDSVLKVAMDNFTWEKEQPVFGHMGIQILLGIAFICIAFLYLKQKRKNVV